MSRRGAKFPASPLTRKDVRDAAGAILAGVVAKDDLRCEYGRVAIVNRGEVLTADLLRRLPFDMIPFIHVPLVPWLKVMDAFDAYYEQERQARQKTAEALKSGIRGEGQKDSKSDSKPVNLNFKAAC